MKKGNEQLEKIGFVYSTKISQNQNLTGSPLGGVQIIIEGSNSVSH